MALNPFSPTAGLTQRQRQEQERQTPLRIPVSVPVTNVRDSNVTLYTVPEGRYFILRHIAATDMAAGAVTITVYLVPDGGSAAASNTVYLAFPISAAATVVLDGLVGHLLEPGTAIIADTSDAVAGANFWLWGEELVGGNTA